MFRGRVLAMVFLAIFFVACSDKDPSKPGRKPQKEYTLERPGQWESIASSHIPLVEKIEGKHGENIRIVVPIKNSSDRHYIEKVGIMDANGNDLVVKSFRPRRQIRVVADFTLKPIPKGAKAFAKCNLHDLWTAPLDF